MSRDLRKDLEAAESELRLALAAERAQISGAGIRRLRAEVAVDHARTACAVARGMVARDFGPDGAE